MDSSPLKQHHANALKPRLGQHAWCKRSIPRQIGKNALGRCLSPAAIIRTAILILLPLLSTGCDLFKARAPGIGKPVAWSELPGWEKDRLVDAWPVLLAQCPRVSRKDQGWQAICTAAADIPADDENAIRHFLQTRFVPHEILGRKGTREGLITGYYQPILLGSRKPSAKYRYPLYARPDELLKIELGELFPELKGKRVRGRLVGSKVIPFYARSEIEQEPSPLKGQELLWIDDPYGAFFLQIQGSGKVRLDDGSLVGVNYADQNGHPYVSIGKKLVEMGAMPLEDVSLFSIRSWLERHPEQADNLLNSNPSYVFFTLRKNADENPRGSLNVPLTDLRSVAVDRKVIPLGSLLWLDTTLPRGQALQRLMFAQDTGGAINGPVRADVFFGTGKQAEQWAGSMKQAGRVYILKPGTGQDSD